MACLDVSPSAPDQLNQLGDLKSFFDTAFGYVTSAGKAVADNSGAIVNILDATARLKAQTAASAALVKTAAANVKTAPPATLTPQQWLDLQAKGVNQPTKLPSWLLPAALGVGALVLVMVLMPRRGPSNG